jgi:hypothetical protein
MTPNVNGSKGPIPKRRAESHRERYGTCASCKNTRQHQDHNLPENQPHDVASLRAKGHADSNLLRTLPYPV